MAELGPFHEQLAYLVKGWVKEAANFSDMSAIRHAFKFVLAVYFDVPIPDFGRPDDIGVGGAHAESNSFDVSKVFEEELGIFLTGFADDPSVVLDYQFVWTMVANTLFDLTSDWTEDESQTMLPAAPASVSSLAGPSSSTSTSPSSPTYILSLIHLYALRSSDKEPLDIDIVINPGDNLARALTAVEKHGSRCVNLQVESASEDLTIDVVHGPMLRKLIKKISSTLRTLHWSVNFKESLPLYVGRFTALTALAISPDCIFRSRDDHGVVFKTVRSITLLYVESTKEIFPLFRVFARSFPRASHFVLEVPLGDAAVNRNLRAPANADLLILDHGAGKYPGWRQSSVDVMLRHFNAVNIPLIVVIHPLADMMERAASEHGAQYRLQMATYGSRVRAVLHTALGGRRWILDDVGMSHIKSYLHGPYWADLTHLALPLWLDGDFMHELAQSSPSAIRSLTLIINSTVDASSSIKASSTFTADTGTTRIVLPDLPFEVKQPENVLQFQGGQWTCPHLTTLRIAATIPPDLNVPGPELDKIETIFPIPRISAGDVCEFIAYHHIPATMVVKVAQNVEFEQDWDVVCASVLLCGNEVVRED
ncbi:hypothetical protein EXIGLDRAFT_837047 [Exidia glandulosa HHB12029]|uniref:Uncharacterized protein n=1 Tax=Exidia glandulosa HHB12029 TaxID=1314781 RepID=A0A165H7U0_EXIGL|nr:hypothetical protein EXIGLDRAFT_837047 [Exidia glandulosa HHB12029]